MKRIFAAIVSLLILFSFVVSAFSADIDGFDMGTEWDGATTYKLVDGESNCNVNFGAVKVKFDSENSAVFLCFMFIDPNMELDNTLVGISLEIENSSPFEITMSSSPAGYDISKYSFDAAMSIDENSGATCEVRIGVKEGLPKALDCTVRFIDASGEPSNYYDFTLVNEEYVETTALVIAPTQDNSDPAYNPDLLTSKTTKAKTTKVKTTKIKTTREKTTKKTTTKRQTTTKKTAIKTTKARTSTAKAETENKTTKAKAVETAAVVTVYYYEKEVVIVQQTPQTSAEMRAETTVQTTAYEPTTAEYAEVFETQKSISLSQGQKYKKIITAIGGVLFLIIAAFGVFSAKRNKNTSEKEETE